MPPNGNTGTGAASPAIAPDEPAPFTILNAHAEAPLLLVCDHASPRLPRLLGDLGLDPPARRSHLAVDIGAGALVRCLAADLGATAVLGNYSRLVVDLNRELMDPAAFLEYGDGVVIPGNRNLSPESKAARAEAFYRPYHRAIDEQIARLRTAGCEPAVVAVHSFTPVLDGVSRPWQMGILWDADRGFAKAMIRLLREAGYVVGDNEPYSGKAPQDYTIDTHAEAAGLPHVGIEVRQDLVDGEHSARAVAAVLGSALERALPATDAGGLAGDATREASRARQGQWQ
jgi:predicted N-formylglutamate amidohydrolase